MTPGNEPAFPGGYEMSGYHGLSKLEYFAAMALQGLLAAYTGEQTLPDDEEAAEMAFEYADAMIAESAKEVK